MAENVKGLNKMKRDLAAFPKAVLEEFAKESGDVVVEALIGSAKAGIGPGDKAYPPYSESYRKQLGIGGGSVSAKLATAHPSTGGKKNFLLLSGTMLDPLLFSWAVLTDGLELTWTAPNERTGIYAEVHNDGLPIGRGGPIKRREFMHFASAKIREAVMIGFERAIGNISQKFSDDRSLR